MSSRLQLDVRNLSLPVPSGERLRAKGRYSVICSFLCDPYPSAFSVTYYDKGTHYINTLTFTFYL